MESLLVTQRKTSWVPERERDLNPGPLEWQAKTLPLCYRGLLLDQIFLPRLMQKHVWIKSVCEITIQPEKKSGMGRLTEVLFWILSAEFFSALMRYFFALAFPGYGFFVVSLHIFGFIFIPRLSPLFPSVRNKTSCTFCLWWWQFSSKRLHSYPYSRREWSSHNEARSRTTFCNSKMQPLWCQRLV